MVEKDHLVQKTKEEMMYFKREMLNREESYNQKFNARPNVGVMQVLKSKDPPDSKKGNNRSGAGSSSKTSLPLPMGMGGGVGGMGVGVGGISSKGNNR